MEKDASSRRVTSYQILNLACLFTQALSLPTPFHRDDYPAAENLCIKKPSSTRRHLCKLLLSPTAPAVLRYVVCCRLVSVIRMEEPTPSFVCDKSRRRRGWLRTVASHGPDFDETNQRAVGWGCDRVHPSEPASDVALGRG